MGNLPPPEGASFGPPPGGEGGADPGPPPGGGPSGVPTLNKEMIAYYWRFLREDRGKLIWACILIVVTGCMPAISGMIPAILTSHWTPEKAPSLWWVLAGILVLTILFDLLQWVETWLNSNVAQNFGRRVRLAIFSKIGNLPAVSMNTQSVGALAYRSSSDVVRIQDMLMPTLPMALNNAAQLLFLGIALFSLGPGFAAAGLILVPVIWFIVGHLNRRVQDYAHLGQKQSEIIMTRFIEGVGGFRDLVAAGRFDDAIKAFDQRLDASRQTSIKTSLINYWTSFVPLLGFTVYLFTFYFIQTSNTAAVGDLTYIGKVISFASLVSMVQGPALQLSHLLTEAALAAPSFFEVRNLLDAPEVADIERGRKPVVGDIVARDVTFAYTPGGRPTLEGVSFEIAAGSFTAIVGQTGSGKSTLFYLLLRLLEPQHGQISIGGIPLREVALDDLREFIGFIPQAPFIFDASIRENLCMGVPKDRFEESRIENAIRTARLEKLIAGRTEAGGIEAPVGPGGSTLSGGERQRIALGRIFLRDPEIIVCDEYTANIDNATARLIHEALAKAFAGKTRIVITHQLYTVRGADKILVIDKGRIVDSGTHTELLARPGLYREMWEVQRLE